jgi:hypothetical protein
MSNLTPPPSTTNQTPNKHQAPTTTNPACRSMEWPVERNRKTVRERLMERTAKRANLIDLLRNVKAVCEKAGFTFEDLLRDV